MRGVAAHRQQSAGALLVVGLVAACLASSRLVVTLEGCFGIIFRLRGRDPLRQNRMALGMLALYPVVVPVVCLISIPPTRRWRHSRTWRRNWTGSVVVAVLLVLDAGLFRRYQQHLLPADNDGTLAGFAHVILLFLYSLAFIVLLGAEVNS